MRFAEIVKLLSAPYPVQDSLFGDLPENATVQGFNWCNDIYRMAVLFLESLTVNEGDGGSEGVEHWRARTGIQSDTQLPTIWLTTAVRMLIDLKKPFLFTRHGLRSADEWDLIRHLAGQVCDEMGWSREMRYADFGKLWDELSDGVLDEEIDRTRWRIQEGEVSA